MFPNGTPHINTWKRDLAAAKIPYADDNGQRLDFHAGARKTMNTRNFKSGMAPAVAMRLMRHTDVKLTMVDYVDDENIGLEDAVLPELLATPKPEGAEAANTG